MLINYLENKPYLTLIIASLALYYVNIDILPVSIMEARNFIVAREMLTENNWLLTTMNGIARYEKPPLPSWVTSFFVGLFDNESIWVYRLPVSIFSTLGLIAMYKLSFALSGLKKQSLYAALILGTSFYYIAIRFEAPSDMFTHVAMLFSMYYLIQVAHDKKKFYSSILGGLWLAASILSKGPVSLYALWLPFIIAFVVVFNFHFKIKIGYYLLYLVLGLVIGSSWYLYVRMEDPIGFLEIAETETNNWSSYNVRPFYYYWSFFIQSGIWAIPALLSLAYPYFKEKIENKKLYLFSFIWTLAAVVLLSLIPEKKSRYLMPALIPLSLNTVQILLYLIKSQKSNFKTLISVILLLICLVILIAPPILIHHSFQFWLWYVSFALFSLIILSTTVQHLKQVNFKPIIWNYFFIIMLTTTIGMNGILFLKKNDSYKSPNQKLTTKEVEYYYYKEISPEVIFEVGKVLKVANFDTLEEFPAFIVVESNNLKEFMQNLPEHLDYKTINTYDLNYFKNKDNRGYKSRYQVKIIKVKPKPKPTL